YDKDPQRHMGRALRWHARNPERVRELDRKRHQTEQRKGWIKNWRKEHPENVRQMSIRSEQKRKHSGKAKEYRTKWRGENREHWNELQRKSYTKKRATVKGRIDHNISSAIRISSRGMKAGRSWESVVGYGVHELHARLRETMPDGYGWADYMNGALEIDHIIPKSRFEYDSTDCDAFLQCWSLGNLQLLTAHDNRSKGANLK
ncbi:MAG: hypothetical protein KAT70_00440, partial [Thermoplasmata archaeon]|nr:hypothetical protein [Thermoplasmata archaeon]